MRKKDGAARDADFTKLDAESQAKAESDAGSNGAAVDTKQDSDPADREPSAQADMQLLRNELEQANKKATESHEKYLRALADFDNFKKQKIKERSDMLKYQGEAIFTDLLEVVDNFERALQSADSHPEQFKSGVQLISKMLGDILAKHGVLAESAIGEKFEPLKHHALSQTYSPDASPGSVIEELKKAYFYKDKLIRIADVVVAAESPVVESPEVDATQTESVPPAESKPEEE